MNCPSLEILKNRKAIEQYMALYSGYGTMLSWVFCIPELQNINGHKRIKISFYFYSQYCYCVPLCYTYEENSRELTTEPPQILSYTVGDLRKLVYAGKAYEIHPVTLI